MRYPPLHLANMIQRQIDDLAQYCRQKGMADPVVDQFPNGGLLIRINDVDIGSGWNHQSVNVLFVAPPGYPNGQPDCFWVEPKGLRLANGATPKASNDSNPIPGDTVPNRQTTWFSWHVQSWNPSTDTLRGYFKVIMDRFAQAQ